MGQQFDAARSKQMGILKEKTLGGQGMELEEPNHKHTSVYYPQYVDSDSEEPEMDSEEPEEDPEEEPEEDPEEEPEEDPEEEPEEDPKEELQVDQEMDGKFCNKKVVAVECATPSRLSNKIVSAEQLTEHEDEDPLAECVSKPNSKSETGKVYQNLLDGKQRMVINALVKPSLSQNNGLEKNCKYDEASKQEFKIKYAAVDQHRVPRELEAAAVGIKNSVEQANPGKRRCSKWEQGSGEDKKAVIEDRKCKKSKKLWDANDSESTLKVPLQLTDLRSKLCGTLLDLEVQSLTKRYAEISSILDPLADSQLDIGVYAPDKLIKEREKIFFELAKRNATISKELYIPMKEYPTYNFIGLILGPKGNTQKRMELKSGARIRVRGKASSKSAQEADPPDDEDLYVYIEAISQKNLDAAECMVKKLLIPVEEEKNDHKQAQLLELFNLKAASVFSLCSVCKEPGHNQLACPQKKTTLKTACDTCGSFSHPTFGCPAKIKSSKEIDATNLYIGFLPQTIDDSGLLELFSPFGTITKSRVQLDLRTGYSMGYGFVKYDTPSAASLAIKHMNGYQIDGHKLRVRIAGAPPSTAQPATNLFPVYSNPGPAAVATTYPASPHNMMPIAEVSVHGEGIDVPSINTDVPSINTESSYQISQTEAPIIPEEVSGSNLYVGFLPQTIDDSRFWELFSPFGTIIQLKVPLDMRTGYSKGYGFVRFDTPSAASLAIMHMNGYEIDGHRLTVRIAGAPPATGQPATSLLPVFPNPGPATVATSCPALPDGVFPEAQVSVLNGEGLCYPSSLHMVYSTNLYVGFLPRTIDDSCLRELFSQFGTVTQSRVILDMITGCSKGYGFVSFDTPYAASLAMMHMNGCQIDGHRLTVRMRSASAAPPTGPPPATSFLPVYSYIPQPTAVATRCPALPNYMMPEFSQNMENKNKNEAPISPQEVSELTSSSTPLSSSAFVLKSTEPGTASSSTSLILGSKGSRTALPSSGLVAKSTESRSVISSYSFSSLFCSDPGNPDSDS